jgi:hypothetical protein
VRKAWVLIALVACGKSEEPLPAQTNLVFVTDETPLPASCGVGQPGTLYSGMAVEPMVAIDPGDQLHICGAWQQDRFSNSGAAALLSACSFDGGHTWTRSALPYTGCMGGTYQRASDPWISIAPDGTVHQVALAFNMTDYSRTILASRSTDGGRTWSTPVALQADTSAQFAMDKETITADPNDSHYVYAVWDRFDGPTNPPDATTHAPTWFARSTDGGLTWETARIIYDPGAGFQTVGNQIVVLPGGRLINAFTFTSVSDNATDFEQRVQVSDDHGLTWSTPITVNTMLANGVIDPKQGNGPVRTGDVLASIAVDASTGQVYAAWEDSRLASGAMDSAGDTVILSRSDDGGATWTTPVVVNGHTSAQAFTPAVSAANGVVAVSYYDTRDDIGEPDRLRVSRWLATSTDSGASFADARVSEPFDLQMAPKDDGYFLGDYMGIAHAGGAFLPFFIVTTPGNRTDVVFRPADEPPLTALQGPTVAQRASALWTRVRARSKVILGR